MFTDGSDSTQAEQCGPTQDDKHLARCRLLPSLARRLPHRYVTLDDDEFRLLTLFPGDRDAPLCCSLHVANLRAFEDFLTTSPVKRFDRYHAISYVWGSRKHRVDLICKCSNSIAVQ